MRRAEVVTGEKESTPSRSPAYNRGSRSQAPWNNNWRAPGGNIGSTGAWRGKSAVQCFNCQGYGHTKDVCSSASRKAAKRIDGVKSGKGKGKADKKVDEERFELLEGKRRIMEVEETETLTPVPAPKEMEKAGTQASRGTGYSWEPTPHTPANKKARVGSWADEVEIEMGTGADGPHHW